MKTLKAFILGVCEFRQSFTTRVPFGVEHAYNAGREFAHRITFRRYD